MKEKLRKELLKTFYIEDIEFKVYGGTARNNLGQVIASCNSGNKVIDFTVYGWVNHSFLESYFKDRLLFYKSVFNGLAELDKHVKNWNEARQYLAAFKKYEEKELRKDVKVVRCNIENSHDENKYPNAIEIEELIKSEKGHSFSGLFVCKICNCTHSHGFSYLIRGHQINVCTYCRSDIRRMKGFIKIISTNMGHGKK